MSVGFLSQGQHYFLETEDINQWELNQWGQKSEEKNGGE
jgi:hypothetical protein